MSPAKENDIEEGLYPPPFNDQDDDNSSSANSSARSAGPNPPGVDNLAALLFGIAKPATSTTSPVKEMSIISPIKEIMSASPANIQMRDIEEGVDMSPIDSRDGSNPSSGASPQAPITNVLSLDDSVASALAVIARLEESIDYCADNDEESSSSDNPLDRTYPSMATGEAIGSEQDSDSQPLSPDSFPGSLSTPGSFEFPGSLQSPGSMEIEDDGRNATTVWSENVSDNATTRRSNVIPMSDEQTAAAEEIDITEGLIAFPIRGGIGEDDSGVHDSNPPSSSASLGQLVEDTNVPAVDIGQGFDDEMPGAKPRLASAALPPSSTLPPEVAAAMMTEAVHADEGDLEMIDGSVANPPPSSGVPSSLPDHEPLPPSNIRTETRAGHSTGHYMDVSTHSGNRPPVIAAEDVGNAADGPLMTSISAEEDSDDSVLRALMSDSVFTASVDVSEHMEETNMDEQSASAGDIESNVALSSSMSEDTNIQMMAQGSQGISSEEADLNDTFYTAADQDENEDAVDANKDALQQEEASLPSQSKDSSVNAHLNANIEANFEEQEEYPDEGKVDLNDTFATAVDQDVDAYLEDAAEEVKVDDSTSIKSAPDDDSTADFIGEIDMSYSHGTSSDRESDKEGDNANEEVLREGNVSPSNSNARSGDDGNFIDQVEQSGDAVEEDLSDDYELTRVQKLDATDHTDEDSLREQEGSPSKSNAASVEAAENDQANKSGNEDRSSMVASPANEINAEDDLVQLPVPRTLGDGESGAASQDQTFLAQSSPHSDVEVADDGKTDDVETKTLAAPATSAMPPVRLKMNDDDDDASPPLPPAIIAAAYEDELLYGLATTNDSTEIVAPSRMTAAAIGSEQCYLPSGPEMNNDDGPEPPFPAGEIMEGKSNDDNGSPVGPEDIPDTEPIPTNLITEATAYENDHDDAIKQSLKTTAPLTTKSAAQEMIASSKDQEESAAEIEPEIEPAVKIIGDESLAPVPFGAALIEDSDVQKAPPQTHGSTPVDNTLPSQDVDEEAQNLEEEKQEEEDSSHISSVSSQTYNHEENEYVIPHAYIPEDGDGIAVVDAEPLLPWWKEKRTRMLFGLICLIAIAAAIAIGASLSRDKTVVTEVISIVLTPVPSTSSIPALEPTTSLSTTPVPSIRFIPTLEPITTLPTLTPTGVPSSSQAPSYTPTYCVNKISKAAKSIDLPLNNPVRILIKLSGRNAVLVAREGDSFSIYIVFFVLNANNEWARTGIFIESYEELVDEIVYDYAIALYGNTALVGFPQKDAGAGLVYTYEQRSDGFWEKADPLKLTDGGSKGSFFGHRVDMDGDLALVGALHEKVFYIFQKMQSGWEQRTKVGIDYEAVSLFLKGNTIVGLDGVFAEIHMYQYGGVNSTVVTLQEKIAVDSGTREFGSAFKQIEVTGTATMVANIRLEGDYLVYSTNVFDNTDISWSVGGVHVYQRQGNVFNYWQDFNSTDYEERFGWELAIQNDMLVIGGGNRTFVFSETPSGHFEESFQLNQSYDQFQMSNRHVFAITYENEAYAMNFEECTQQVPTQLPSSSLVPTTMPSISANPSTIIPTSTAPSVTLLPSLVPSSSLVPSTSSAPSHVPTVSLSPTICYDVRVVIMTTGANTEGFEEDVTSWELYNKQSGEVIIQGGPFKDDQIDEYTVECIEGSDYEFSIANSRGNGFGECATCGYFVFVDDIYIGGMTEFHDNDRLHFSLPLYQREPNESLPSYNGIPICGGDFVMAIQHDDHPSEITWDLANEEGEIVLSGGPYKKIYGLNREFACLRDGEHTFTIYNSQEKASTAQGVYFMGIYYSDILVQSDLNFGASESTTFVTGAQDEQESTQSRDAFD